MALSANVCGCEVNGFISNKVLSYTASRICVANEPDSVCNGRVMQMLSVSAQTRERPIAAARVLLVEDETLLRLVTAKRLRDDGFEVVAPRHGEESRAPFGDPDDLVARAPGNAGMQAQANALTGRIMAPDAIINELKTRSLRLPLCHRALHPQRTLARSRCRRR